MFITFEGIEGSGKSTALIGLCDYLEKQGFEVIRTREPGGSALGQNLRSTLLDERSKLCSEAELFLFLADRAQHVQEVIRPALEQGKFVLCDRYVDSTLAYQGAGRGLDIEKLLSLHELCTHNLWPNLTLLLDLPVNLGLERATKRNDAQVGGANEKRFDKESVNFHEQVRQNYHAQAALDKERIRVIDASNTPAIVIEHCIQAVQKIIRKAV